MRRWIELWDQTFREDMTAARNQQRGMRTGRLAQSRFVTSQERPLVFINRKILEAYQQGLELTAPGSQSPVA